MKVLLDTNAFISTLLDERLPRAVRGFLESGTTEIVVSIVVPWEIATKGNESFGRRRRLNLTTRDVKEAIETMGARLLPITIEHTEILYRLPILHRDPFDRMIIAQALEQRCPVLSADRRFELYKGEGLQVIWD